MKKIFFAIYIVTASIAFSCVNPQEVNLGACCSGLCVDNQRLRGNKVHIQSDFGSAFQRVNYLSSLKMLAPEQVFPVPIVLSQDSLARPMTSFHEALYAQFPTLAGLCQSEWTTPHAVQIFVFPGGFFGQGACNIVIFLSAPTEQKEDFMSHIERQGQLQSFDQKMTKINSIASPYVYRVFNMSQRLYFDENGVLRTEERPQTFNGIYQSFLEVVPAEKKEDFYRLCSSSHVQPLLCVQYLAQYRNNLRSKEIHSYITTALFVEEGFVEKMDFETKRFVLHMCQNGDLLRNAEARYNYAVMHHQGCLVVKDFLKAFRLCKMAADQGHAAAQFYCGTMYYKGEGVARNPKTALMYLEAAAAQGHAAAQFNCGIMHYYGEGVEKDLKIALRYFEAAAAQGHAAAQFNCGIMHYYGEGVEKDLKIALRYWEMAADRGHAAAQFYCGIMYYKGEGVARNPQSALMHFEAAAAQGHAAAQFYCGIMYYQDEGVKKDLETALMYWTMAAVQGYVEAQFNCGTMYYHGEGVTRDLEIALRYWEMAADQGHVEARRSLDTFRKNFSFLSFSLPTRAHLCCA